MHWIPTAPQTCSCLGLGSKQSALVSGHSQRACPPKCFQKECTCRPQKLSEGWRCNLLTQTVTLRHLSVISLTVTYYNSNVSEPFFSVSLTWQNPPAGLLNLWLWNFSSNTQGQVTTLQFCSKWAWTLTFEEYSVPWDCYDRLVESQFLLTIYYA